MKKPLIRTLLITSIAAAIALPIAAYASPQPAPQTQEARRAQLEKLLSSHWEEQMKENPEWASMLGDKRYNDKLSDFSQAKIDQGMRDNQLWLKKFKALNVEGLNEQERLSRDLMVRSLEMAIEGGKLKGWQMPLLHNYGIHIDAPQMVSALSFKTVKDYEDYIARLNQLPRLFEQTIVQMKKGMQNKIMPPKFLIEKVVKQCDDIAMLSSEKSPFAQPLEKMPASFSEADKKRLSAAIHAAIAKKIAPAYKNLSSFVKNEYAPQGRSEVGLWSLPQGDIRYAFQAKTSTTTNMTPEEIHQLGLAEVARIEAEMLKVAVKLGYQDVASFNAAILKNPDFNPKSRDEIVQLYRKYTDEAYKKLPQLFGRLPIAKVEIKAIEEFREKGAPAAQYSDPALDGSRPGRVFVNTSEFEKRSIINIESTALHEGVPGHHMQIAIAQELPALPKFRKNAMFGAYVEGWALYAEQLGREIGAYQDPYNYYGHLQAEMMRAIRLVVDTGLHHKKWSRQQVVDFFRAHSSMDDVAIQSETDRYIAWPGQALSYKIGQLKISQLRNFAQQELGTRFDIRAFHDLILGSGALPLDVLETKVTGWVQKQKVLAAN